MKSISTSFQKSLLPKMTKFTKKKLVSMWSEWTNTTKNGQLKRSKFGQNIPISPILHSIFHVIHSYFKFPSILQLKNDQIRAKINKSWSNLSSIGQNLVATNQISPKMTSNRSNMIKFNENDQRNEWKWTEFNEKTKIW